MYEAYLARFVLDRALPAEPVATGLLAHVLQQSEEARAALHRWLDSLVPGIPSGLVWSAEESEKQVPAGQMSSDPIRTAPAW